ncbi:formylglycine-generating enzyme family protein [Glutamicibacter uratoxydans]|uniref:formylglycine-generating enzyme family protein n=1 Tax=Glutamicibacter uratoxydans TaxID=43667 RepID=UPI003D6E7ECA
MIRIPAGSFLQGSTAFYPDEGPVRETFVETFEIDLTPVTNAQFGEFVAATGYRTVAERSLPVEQFPTLGGAERAPGSLVFTPTTHPVDLSDWRQWWRWVPGAQWRHPYGVEHSAVAEADHPVVQVAYEDAQAYAQWRGQRLPTEAEWEYAARGGLVGATYAWGDEPQDPQNLLANTWQGKFPYLNTGANGWVGTSPVRSFAPNGYGLYDMIGNVWEWTSTSYTPSATSGCSCTPATPVPGADLTLKGGSHLCAPEYCLRYRPAARSAQSPDSATTHIGFRCVRSLS